MNAIASRYWILCGSATWLQDSGPPTIISNAQYKGRTEWKKQLLERPAEVLDGSAAEEPMDLASHHAKLGQFGAGERLFGKGAHQ